MKHGMLNLYECTINYTSHPTKFKEVFQRPVDRLFQEVVNSENIAYLTRKRVFESYLCELKRLKHRFETKLVLFKS